MKKVNKNKQSKGPVFAITFDPRLPPIGNIEAKHWRSMTSKDSYLAEVFKRPPLVAFKRQKNLRQYLIRAKVPIEQNRPQRLLKGMKKCGEGCTACPYIKEGKTININGKVWNINQKLNCKSFNVVYALKCKKENCGKTYIGETKRYLKSRLDDHRGYIVNSLTSKATGEHFTQPGHSLADLQVTVLEQVKKNNTLYRKEREEYFIRKFNTFHNGINKKT